jgi:hypothetical protein
LYYEKILHPIILDCTNSTFNYLVGQSFPTRTCWMLTVHRSIILQSLSSLTSYVKGWDAKTVWMHKLKYNKCSYGSSSYNWQTGYLVMNRPLKECETAEQGKEWLIKRHETWENTKLLSLQLCPQQNPTWNNWILNAGWQCSIKFVTTQNKITGWHLLMVFDWDFSNCHLIIRDTYASLTISV